MTQPTKALLALALLAAMARPLEAGEGLERGRRFDVETRVVVSFPGQPEQVMEQRARDHRETRLVVERRDQSGPTEVTLEVRARLRDGPGFGGRPLGSNPIAGRRYRFDLKGAERRVQRADGASAGAPELAALERDEPGLPRTIQRLLRRLRPKPLAPGASAELPERTLRDLLSLSSPSFKFERRRLSRRASSSGALETYDIAITGSARHEDGMTQKLSARGELRVTALDTELEIDGKMLVSTASMGRRMDGASVLRLRCTESLVRRPPANEAPPSEGSAKPR